MTNDSVCPECGSRDVYSRASEHMCGSCGHRFSIGASFQYDVFISYRGDGTGNLFANRLADDLESMGYSVYFNSKERRSGRFDERIGDAIAGCTDFIPIVTKGYLDRLYSTSEKDTNWVREELRMAMRHRDTVRITPIYLDGAMPPNALNRGEAFGIDDIDDFALFDGVEMPGENYKLSPFDALLKRLNPYPCGYDMYQNLSNGNPGYQANERLAGYIKAANEGDFAAMYYAGLMLYYCFCTDARGTAVRDLKRAKYWVEKVIGEAPEEMRAIRSCANNLLAKMYYQGDPVPQSYSKSLRHLLESKEDPSAITQAAFMIGSGLGCERDFDYAEQLHASQPNSYGFSHEDLARFYERAGRFHEAEQAYLRMKNPSSVSEYRLGLIYRNGSHVSPPHPDYERAGLHFQRAHDEGNIDATFELASMYFYGSSSPFPKDFRKAQEYFKQAADAGNMSAQYNYAYMCEYGHVKKDLDMAIKYHEMAAKQGHIWSYTSLARLYQIRKPPNYQRAYKCCKYAAERQNSQAEFCLGILLLLGRGCDYDVAKAKYWLKRAESHGFMNARLLLDSLDDDDGVGYRPEWLPNS